VQLRLEKRVLLAQSEPVNGENLVNSKGCAIQPSIKASLAGADCPGTGLEVSA
jgi:hypothetical protein